MDENRHNEVLKSLELISDTMLLSVYRRITRGDEVIPCKADTSGNYLYLLSNGLWGKMLDDGSVHT